MKSIEKSIEQYVYERIETITDCVFKGNKEYIMLNNELTMLMEQLRLLLTPEQETLILKFESKMNEQYSIMEFYLYQMGIKEGLQLQKYLNNISLENIS